MRHMKIAALAAAITLTTGCAANDPHKRAKAGAAIGALTGAVIGHQVNDNNGRYAGAAVGALTGALVGNYMDKQQKQLEQELAVERQNNDIRLVRIDEETLKLELDAESTFDVNSASVKSQFQNSLAKVSGVVSEYGQTAVHVVGHTDSTGSSSYNQQLSEKRANSVGIHLSSGGVDRSRMRLSGRGEAMPVGDNSTSYGRTQNRRVEIYIKPFVEGRENEAYRSPI